MLGRTNIFGLMLPALMLVPGALAAQTPTEQFELASSAFEYQDYDKAVALLKPLLDPEPTIPAAMVLRGREMLGASLWWKKERQEAQYQFTKLLISRPEYELDSFYYPAEMVDEFEALRKRLADAGIIETSGGTAGRCVQTAAEPPSQLVALVPFGAPQFTQGRTVAGSLFLSGQALALGGNIGAWSYLYFVEPRGPDRDAPILLMYGSLAMFGALYVWGAVDALVASAPKSAPVPAGSSVSPGSAWGLLPVVGSGEPGLLLDLRF